MSKSERMRELQQEINGLRQEKKDLRKKIEAYRHRDKSVAGDFIYAKGRENDGRRQTH